MDTHAVGSADVSEPFKDFEVYTVEVSFCMWTRLL